MPTKSSQHFHKGHRERVKEKFAQSEFEHMHPHEILEFLLFFSIPRRDTNPIAHDLIRTFGDLKKVFDASYDDLISIDGIGESSALLIKSIPLLFREYKDCDTTGLLLDNTEASGKYFLSKFIGRNEETVIVAFLNNKMGVIKRQIVNKGSVNLTHINIRTIVELCVKYKASSIIISHNHPNGIAIPSSADRVTTTKLKQALALINVTLIDHIIVADDDFVSMADSNML